MDLRPRKFGKVACLGDENFVRHIRRYGSQNFHWKAGKIGKLAGSWSPFNGCDVYI